MNFRVIHSHAEENESFLEDAENKTWKNLGDKNGQCNSVVDIAWSHRRSEEFSNKHGSQTCENNSNYDLPSGQLTVCYGKSQILLGRSTITGPISIVCCRFTRPGRLIPLRPSYLSYM